MNGETWLCLHGVIPHDGSGSRPNAIFLERSWSTSTLGLYLDWTKRGIHIARVCKNPKKELEPIYSFSNMESLFIACIPFMVIANIHQHGDVIIRGCDAWHAPDFSFWLDQRFELHKKIGLCVCGHITSAKLESSGTEAWSYQLYTIAYPVKNTRLYIIIWHQKSYLGNPRHKMTPCHVLQPCVSDSAHVFKGLCREFVECSMWLGRLRFPPSGLRPCPISRQSWKHDQWHGRAQTEGNGLDTALAFHSYR